MELMQLRYFRTVAECGSFSLAAEHLHLTQPALSKSIAKLEDELGAPLFERKGNRIFLTSAGRIFLPYCGNVLSAVQNGVTAFQESIGLKHGQVTIAISTEVFIKHLILQFLQEYPDVQFTCHLMDIEEMAHALDAGTVDFVLSDQPVRGNQISWNQIYSGHLTAVLNDKDPLLKRSSISMEDLRDHQFCMGHLRSTLHSMIYELCREAGFEPRVRYLGHDPDMAGLLLAIPNSVIISSTAINHSIQRAGVGKGQFPSIPIRGTDGQAIIGMGARIGHYQSEAAIAFSDLVTAYFQSIDEKRFS